MHNFFDIKSVVIVWASQKEWKIGNSLLKNLIFFGWEKYWVNPKWWEYDWIKFFKTINELPLIPDIAVFAIPAKFVLSSMQEIWEKWIKRVIIISAGFKEVWNIELEKKLIKIIKKYNIKLVWPNCLWYLDSSRNLNLSFWTNHFNIYAWPNSQNVAMISQSWAVAGALTDWALSRKMWFSKMISMWNKAWIDENYLLKQLKNDRQTKVIALYLESITNGKDFFNITRKITKTHPIVLVKSGISVKGGMAARSHTWALASQKEIQQAAFAAAWIHFTQSLEDFFLWTRVFSRTDINYVSEELVIITNAWGLWVMATDHCDTYNVKLSKFTQEEKNILKTGLSELSSFSNPIDILWNATSLTFNQIFNNLLKLDKKRSILLMLTAQSVTDVENISKLIIKFKKENPTRFIMVSFMGWERIVKWRQILNDAGILEYNYPIKAIISFSVLIKQKKWQNSINYKVKRFTLPKNIDQLKAKLELQEKFCKNDLTWEILKSFKINHQEEIIVNSEKEAQLAFDKINSGYCVARISSPDIPHKSDIWWVILFIKSKEEALDAYKKILENVAIHKPDAKINWIAFAKMITKRSLTRKIFVWFKRDPSFWNILIVWMWWTFVNVFEDVSRRIWIVSKKEIKKMLWELVFSPILEWTRWQAWINFTKLINIIYKLQFIFEEFTKISEIDINPIFSDPNDSIIIDAKFYL